MRKAFSNLCTSPSGLLFENALLQVAVDKLFRLYFQSKDGVGSYSDFVEGEKWW